MTTNTGTGGDAGNDPRVEAVASVLFTPDCMATDFCDKQKDNCHCRKLARAALAAADAARPVVSDEEVAKVLNEEMEGPISNQDFLRQKRQWEVCLRLAAALRAAGFDVVRR